MLRFAHPEMAQLFWLIPLLVWLVWRGIRQRKRALAVLGEAEVLERLHPTSSPTRHVVKALAAPVAL